MRYMEDLKIYNRIMRLSSLKPSKETNDAFSDLVKYCEENKAINLKRYQIDELRKLSSIAEYEMEIYWATRIIAAKDSREELKKFWYYINYEQLVDLEYINSKNIYYKDIQSVLFVGGGPLPLTSILLCMKYNMPCTILERDKKSNQISFELIKKLGLETKITCTHVDAEDYSDYSSYDIIYVAALVGSTSIIKNKIISRIYDNLTHHSLVLCRSSHGTRRLLYASISKSLLDTLKPVLEVRPYNSIINSFFILQKT